MSSDTEAIYPVLSQIQLKNFRHWTALNWDISPSQKVLITGENATGKSSILEAIQYITTGRSWRSTDNRHLIQHQKNQLSCNAHFKTLSGEEQLKVELGRDRTIYRELNYKKITKLSEITYKFPTLVWSDKLIELVRGSPEVRRKWIDWCVFHVEPYGKYPIKEMYIAIKQKQRILQIAPDDIHQLNAIDNVLADYYIQVWNKRIAYIDKLNILLEQENIKITNIHPDTLNKDDLLKMMSEKRSSEIKLKRLVVGPHTDHYKIQLNGYDLKSFGSNGEQLLTSAILLSKQIQQTTTLSRKKILLLIDDFSTILDSNHQKYVLSQISQINTQIIASSTQQHTHYTETLFDTMFHVEQHTVKQTLT